MRMMSKKASTLLVFAKALFILNSITKVKFHRLWKLIYFLSTKKYGFLETIHGHYVAYLPDDHQQLLYSTGKSGFEIYDYLASIESSFSFLDVGANQGIYSLHALKNKNCNEVYAFEPNPNSYSVLEKNLSYDETDKDLIHIFNVGNIQFSRIITINNPSLAFRIIKFSQERQHRKFSQCGG